MDAPADAFLRALPPIGAELSPRPGAWPTPIALSSVGPGGATLTGAAVPPRALAADLRCDSGEAEVPVQIVADVVEKGPRLTVRVRYEGPEPAACEVSFVGRRRLQSLAASVYLWARGVALQGSDLPTSYR